MPLDDPIPIRLINDFLYCPRRCALHQIERVWIENAFTVSGILAHQSADDSGYRRYLDSIPGKPRRIERALPLFCRGLNLIGRADIVEFYCGSCGGPDVPMPVDYKLGRRRQWENDDAQLCAQASCLEEMFSVHVPAGAVYHVHTRRRRPVVFDDDLRRLTLQTLEAVRDLLATGIIPAAVAKPQCEGCSMRGVCLPQITCQSDRLDRAHRALFGRDPTLVHDPSTA